MLSALRHHRCFDGTFDGAGAAAIWLRGIAATERLPEKLVFAIELCLEELFTNVVRYGGDGRGPHGQKLPLSVDVAVELTENGVELVVGDNGATFDVSHAASAPAHPPLDEVAPGGLGIQLIRSFSDDLLYEPLPNGNRVIVKFLRQEPHDAKAGV